MKKKEFIAQDLLSKIYQRNGLPADERPTKLPPERQLAQEYGASRFTVRKALEKLVDIGAVRIVQGSGIFINSDISNIFFKYNSTTEKKFAQISFRMLNLH